MDITVGELVVRYLQKLGVTHVFGIPGAHILPVFDKLYESDIKTILTKHEQGAAFMASGYARRSGKIGACIATTGPGATNLVTGIANAFMNGTPVLAITGETPTYSFGKGALQESSGEGTAVNQNHIFRGVTKYHKLV
ncbi:MAG: thiamine pyrophosphate-binding protein, partial [Deltaproteobacteria bacterium]|nr:thiamine pyrophosphate-binding protein [Deltaproteobacteria bacterium]